MVDEAGKVGVEDESPQEHSEWVVVREDVERRANVLSLLLLLLFLEDGHCLRQWSHWLLLFLFLLL